MKKTLLIISVLLSVISCNFRKDSLSMEQKILKLLDEHLSRDMYVIPDSLFSFFPDETTRNNFLNIDGISTNAMGCGDTIFHRSIFEPLIIVEYYKFEDFNAIEHLVQNYHSQSVFSTFSNNDDYFALDSERELMLYWDTLQIREDVKNKKNIIPSFKTIFKDDSVLNSETNVVGLKDGFKILVLKQGNDLVIQEHCTSLWAVLPENFVHGYSSGVAYSEEALYIIYWVMAW